MWLKNYAEPKHVDIIHEEADSKDITYKGAVGLTFPTWVLSIGQVQPV